MAVEPFGVVAVGGAAGWRHARTLAVPTTRPAGRAVPVRLPSAGPATRGPWSRDTGTLRRRYCSRDEHDDRTGGPRHARARAPPRSPSWPPPPSPSAPRCGSTGHHRRGAYGGRGEPRLHDRLLRGAAPARGGRRPPPPPGRRRGRACSAPSGWSGSSTACWPRGARTPTRTTSRSPTSPSGSSWRFGAVLLSGLVALLVLYPTGRLLPGRWRPLGVGRARRGVPAPGDAGAWPPTRVVIVDSVPGATERPDGAPDARRGGAGRCCGSASCSPSARSSRAVGLLWVRHRHADARGAHAAPLAALGRDHDRADGRGRPGARPRRLVTTVAAQPGRGLAGGLGGHRAGPARPRRRRRAGGVDPHLGRSSPAHRRRRRPRRARRRERLLGDRLDEREVTIVVLVLAVVVYGPLRGWIGGGVRRVLFGRRGDRYGAVSDLAARLETSGSVEEQLPDARPAPSPRPSRSPSCGSRWSRPTAACSPPPTVDPTSEVQELDIAYRGEPRRPAGAAGASACGRCCRGATRALLVDLVRQAAIAVRAPACWPASCRRAASGWSSAARTTGAGSGATCTTGSGPVLGGVALRLRGRRQRGRDRPRRAPGELVGRRRHRGRARPSTTYAGWSTTCARRRWTTSAWSAAVRQQAERMRPEVAVEVVADELTGLPAAVEVAAYRIVSEALANVVKHARAGHARCGWCSSGDRAGRRGARRRPRASARTSPPASGCSRCGSAPRSSVATAR